MQPVTSADREKELRVLLDQMRARPSHDWSEARMRAAVLTRMIAADAKRAGA